MTKPTDRLLRGKLLVLVNSKPGPSSIIDARRRESFTFYVTIRLPFSVAHWCSSASLIERS